MTGPRRTRHTRQCTDQHCTHCQDIAEDHAAKPGEIDDWQTGQNRYEAEMDRRWGA